MKAGDKLGSYEIVAPIGAGGMGEVWKAHDTVLGRDVAIKTLPGAFVADGDRVARFEREAKLLAALNHANIATIHGLEHSPSPDGSGGQAETLALVMELVEGETLADRTAGGALDPREATRLALQIAEALEAAHEKGIIHRDLKPANIKVTPDGRVKVLDFGLAKAFEGDDGRPDLTNSPTLSLAATQQGVILGTAAYMSPEQASGAPADRRADIWAFGVVFFEMLTGRRLFSGKTVSHVLADVLRAEPDWSALPPRLHPRLRLLLERCLEKEPRDRQRDIGDVRVDLRRALADPDGVLVAPVAPAGVPAASRGRWPLLAAGLLAAVAAGMAGWLLKPDAPAQVVRFARELPEGANFRAANFSSIALSADGRRVAYATSDGLYVLAVDQDEPRLIPGTQPGGLNPADIMFSPDSDWIAYANTNTGTLQLQKVSINGGAPVTLAALGTDYGGGSWTPDNEILFAQGQAILKVSGDGGTPETLFEVAEGVPQAPRMLPGGRSVSYTVLSAAGPETFVRALDGDGAETSFAGGFAHHLPTGHVVFFLQGSLFAQAFDTTSGVPSGGPVPLVEGVMNAPRAQFAVSASGSLAYAPGGAGTASVQLVPAIVSADGRVDELDGIPPGLYSSPRVSPDGTRLALQTTNNAPLNAQTGTIWVYELSGDTALRPLTQAGKNLHPIWTPDGTRLTFYSDRDGTRGIYWQAADGSGVPERLTTATEGTEDWPDSWSPDGRTLVYQVITPASGMVDLWTLSLDTPDEPRALFARPDRQHGAAFSPPGGRWIAYGSTEGSPNAEQIYVEPFPSTGERHQLTRESGAFPVWSRDGTALFYRRNAQGTGGEAATEFVQVDIAGLEAFQWRNERPLAVGAFRVFGGFRDYDVLPDGRFVMLFPAERGAAGTPERRRINVVLNWAEELRARVPVP